MPQLLHALELEPLEKYQDAPAAPIWRHDSSPALNTTYNGFTSYQVNVDASGQNIIGDAANEPSLCVDPTNSSRMAIAWRQFNDVTSNFRQAGWAYTNNGGRNWTFPGVLESNVFRSDPVLGSDTVGNFFYLSLLQTFYDDMWRSATYGQTWARLGPANGGDKEWFTIDNTNSIGHGFQYQIWSTAGNNYNGRQFSRSTDGGTTWSSPINIPNSPVWGTLDVDTNGNLFIAGFNFSSNQIWCIRSSNAKNSAVTTTFDQSTAVNLGGSIDASEPINPEGLVGQLYLAVDKSGTATNNNIYILASVLPDGATSGSDVMFVRSTDGGQSFSAPRRINRDPVNASKWHWMGTLAVAPNGRLDVIWLDTRNAANNTDSQLFYAYSFDGGNTWSPDIAVSNSFDPSVGYPNQDKMGDYMTIVSDNTGGNVAYAATFNGEEDVYYVRVAPVQPVPVSAVSRKTHGAAGIFDLSLPLSGSAGIESRGDPSSNASNHQLVVTFSGNVTVSGVSVTSIDGLASASLSVSGAVVTVNLTNVRDAQTIAVKLSNVNDGAGFGDVTIPMAVLLGDTSGDGSVNSADALQTRNRSGQPLDATNFRADINADGLINSADAAAVRARSGDSLQ